MQLLYMMNRFHLSFYSNINIDQPTYTDQIKCGKQKLKCANCLGRQLIGAWLEQSQYYTSLQLTYPPCTQTACIFIHTQIVGMSLFRCPSHCLSSECVWLLGLSKSDLSRVPTHTDYEV